MYSYKLYPIGLFLAFLLCHALSSKAQRLDPNFEANLQAKGFISDRIELEDGSKIYVGSFKSFARMDSLSPSSSQEVGQIIKILPNGLPDMEFQANIGTAVQTGEIRNVIEQNDGKILLGGSFEVFNDRQVFQLLRLQPNGSLDEEFQRNIGRGFSVGTIQDLLLQSDGKIVVVGSFTEYQGQRVGRIVRLEADGTLDQSFMDNVGSGVDGTINSVAQYPDGKLLLGGSFDSYNLAFIKKLLRLNADGTLDEAFTQSLQGNNIVDDISRTRKIKPRDNGGVFALVDIISSEDRFLAFDETGLLDSSYNNNYEQSIDIQSQVLPDFEILDNDQVFLIGFIVVIDSILLANADTSYKFIGQSFALIDPSGTFDLRFLSPSNVNGVITNEEFIFYDLVFFQKDGTLELTLNPFDSNQFEEVSVFFDLDANLLGVGPFLAQPALISDIEEQPDGKLLVSGNFTLVDNQPQVFLTRLLANGRRDTTFQTGRGPDSQVEAITLQGEQIVVAGSFDEYDGYPTRGLARLFPDGSIDTIFTQNIGTSVNGFIRDIATLSRDLLVIAGDFEVFDGRNVGNFTYLLPDGIYDSIRSPLINFTTNSGSTSIAFVEEIKPSNSNIQVICGGFFTMLSNLPYTNLARVSEGIQDFTFQVNSISGFVDQIAVSPNDEIAIGGSISSVNLLTRNRVALLNSTGALVEEFDLNLEQSPNDLAFQRIGEENRLLVSSRSINLPGAIGRFNLDGSRDRSFLTDLSQGSTADFIKVLDNNDIVISINETGTLFKLITPPEPSTPIDIQANSVDGREIILTWQQDDPNADSIFYEVQRSISSLGNFETIDFTSFGVERFIDQNIVAGQQYYYRVRSINLGNNSRFSPVTGIKISPLITGQAATQSSPFRVSPNPSSGNLSVMGESLGASSTEWKAELSNALGITMARFDLDTLHAQTMDFSYLASGIYYLKLYNHSQYYIIKWIKQ